MERKLLASFGCVLILTGSVSPVGAQARSAGADTKPATKGWTSPRTPDGRPDLQGVWDFSTLTPMERPKELAGKTVLTDQEAAEFEAARLHYENRDRIDPVTGRTAQYAPGQVVPYNEFWYERGTVISTRRTSLVVDPPDGRIPALTPEAEKKRLEAAEARRGVGADEPRPGGWLEDISYPVRCIMGFNSGPPMTPSAYNNVFQLFQTPQYVVILNEMVHTARIVPLDGRPHGNIRQWAGDSRGRWEGDTLVVDTINFHASTSLRGSSPGMHLIERFTRTDAGTLLYEFTVSDPATWTRPWTAAVPMRKGNTIYEYACHEGNYGLTNLLKFARDKERAEEEAARKK
jgi:hypothetical protein